MRSTTLLVEKSLCSASLGRPFLQDFVNLISSRHDFFFQPSHKNATFPIFHEGQRLLWFVICEFCFLRSQKVRKFFIVELKKRNFQTVFSSALCFQNIKYLLNRSRDNTCITRDFTVLARKPKWGQCYIQIMLLEMVVGLPFFLLLLPSCMSSQSLSARTRKWCSYTHQAPQTLWEKLLGDTSPSVATSGQKPNRFKKSKKL